MLSITAEHNTFFQKDITKIIYPTSDFGYFGHAWPLPSKKIMPICLCLSACKKSTSNQNQNQLSHFFLEIM